MYNQFMMDNLLRRKEELDNMIKMYQNQPQPVNNFISTGQTPSKELIEWRILNENEEVDNLYVQTKTLFINDEIMVLKGVDGKLEKWEIRKIYPIDKKDEKINELEKEIKELKEKMNNESTKSIKSTRKCNEPNGIDDVNVEPKPETNGNSIPE